MERRGRGDRQRIGHLAKRLGELKLEKIADPRRFGGRAWALPQLISAALTGMVAGCRSLAETEELTAELSPAAKSKLCLPRRVPDTTMRTTLMRIAPSALRSVLHRQILRAHRRKQLAPDVLPFGVVAIDGKCTATPYIDDKYAQRQTLTADGVPCGVQGLVRTLTFCLTSSRAKVCMDANPIPARTNEVGHFKQAFAEFDSVYRRSGLFEMVTLDAGFFAAEVAAEINDRGYGYVIQLKDERRELRAAAQRLLGHHRATSARAETTDKVGDGVLVKRRIWFKTIGDVPNWPHVRAVIRVQAERNDHGVVTTEDRYYATNYAASGLNAGQWLHLVRSHWAVENNCHWIFDAVLAEDARPWIQAPQGLVAMTLLRRIAFNLLALFRKVTLRSERHRDVSWPRLLRAFYVTFIRYWPRGGAATV